MKLLVRPPAGALGRALDTVRRYFTIPAVRRTVTYIKYGILGFFLGASGSGTMPLPLGLGLLAQAPFGPELLFSAAGALGGTLAFWGIGAGLEPAAVLTLFFVSLAMLEGTDLKKRSAFQPLLASAIAAVLGLLFLLERPSLTRGDLAGFVLRVALAGLSVLCFSRAGRERGTPADWFTAGAYVTAFSQLLLFSRLDLGITLAALLVCAAPPGLGALPLAAVCGLGVDLSRITGVMLTPILALSALAAAAVPKKRLRFLFPCLLSLPLMILMETMDPSVPVSLAVGGAAALFLPRKLVPQPVQEVPGTDPDTAARLQSVSAVLSRIQGLLLTEDACEKPDEAAVVFDQATEQVCRSCLHFDQCWQRNGAETYRELSARAPGLLERGCAREEDLPQAFRERCRRPEPFLQAVNQALFAYRFRRKCRRQLSESRQVLCSQYGFLSAYLNETAGQLDGPPVHRKPQRFRPDIGIRAVGKYGMAVSGDRGACFPGPGSRYYVLLCDGMGTGTGAAQESENAIGLITGLLQAGLTAGAALQMLNGLYLLRNSGGFSTADLLELHLDTGRALLYKWGAAPSYLKHNGYAKKVGSAGPPPGLSLEGGARPEVIRLSLIRGETLVRVSDGISGEETRQRIAGFADRSPKALANYLIASAGDHGEDDRTAIAVCLRPLLSGGTKGP